MRVARIDSRGPSKALRQIVLGSLAFALLSVTTADAATVRSEFFGIVQGQYDVEGQLDDTDLQGMEAAKVRTDRFELGWRSIESTQGTRDWWASDHFVAALASHGIRALPFIWKSPSWISKAPNRPPIDTAAHEQAWRDFLRAAVARYGPGGHFWANRYQQLYPGAKPLPITSWQIWNEPNLRKFFDPGGTDDQLARRYGELLRISHEAIKAEDPNAQIVLAGSPGYPPSGGPRAWEFLNQLYNKVPNAENYFEVAALHPYASDVAHVRIEIQKTRDVMVNHGDRATPLWITEIGWGSDPPDQFGINQGPVGQQQRLSGTYNMILDNRTAWNVQRVYWFLWRDPDPNSPFANRCSFCGSAGLLRFDRTKKRAYNAFVSFTTDTKPPTAYFAPASPGADSVINDPTPTFTFASTDPGSTFQCRIDGAPFKTCTTIYTTPHLSDGPHKISIEAIDATGNVSAVKGRPFTVDTTPPAITITSGPANGSATSSQSASFAFSIDDPNVTVNCQLDNNGFSACSSPFTRSNLPDKTHAFQVRARDQAGNVGGAGVLWTVDTVAPTVTITSGADQDSTSTDPRPSFGFGASESGVTFECHFDSDPFADCTSPFAAKSRLSPNGDHTFEVIARDRAGNTSPTVTRSWTINAPPVDVRIDTGPGPGSVTRDATPTFGFSSSDPLASFECRVGGDAAPFAPCGSDGSGTFTTSHLTDRRHRFSVQAVDDPDQSEIVSRYFTVDTRGPTATITSGPADGSALSDPTPSFGFKASEAGSRFQCRLDSHPFADCSSPYAMGPLPNGSHDFRVRAVDAVGNRGAPSSRSFRIDTRAPRLSIRGPDRVVTGKATASAAFVLKASEPVNRRCRVDSKGFVRCSERYRTPKLGGGAHTLKVHATDRAGNVTTERKRFRIVEKRSGKRHHRRRHR
jgi:hypothetical protein